MALKISHKELTNFILKCGSIIQTAGGRLCAVYNNFIVRCSIYFYLFYFVIFNNMSSRLGIEAFFFFVCGYVIYKWMQLYRYRGFRNKCILTASQIVYKPYLIFQNLSKSQIVSYQETFWKDKSRVVWFSVGVEIFAFFHISCQNQTCRLLNLFFGTSVIFMFLLIFVCSAS